MRSQSYRGGHPSAILWSALKRRGGVAWGFPSAGIGEGGEDVGCTHATGLGRPAIFSTDRVVALIYKSFLVLFCKKELLACLRLLRRLAWWVAKVPAHLTGLLRWWRGVDLCRGVA